MAVTNRGAWINYDMENTPLHIMTDSAAGSGELMWIRFQDDTGSSYGLDVTFSEPPTYDIGYCTSQDPTFTMPPGNLHVWTIFKSTTKLTLHCNGNEIYNYEFSVSSRSECVLTWSGGVTAFEVATTDTASDFYRPYPIHGNY